ncbi:MAG: hypothetical protein WAW52_10580 [Methanothrix sp.]
MDPNLISIVVVIIGGLITYLTAIKIENQKRLYELKKENYIAAIRSFLEIKEDISDGFIKDSSHGIDLNEIRRLKVRNINQALYLIQSMLYISSNDEINFMVKSIIIEIQKTLFELNDRERSIHYDKFVDIVLDNLIPAMKEDLMTTSYRQFWWR